MPSAADPTGSSVPSSSESSAPGEASGPVAPAGTGQHDFDVQKDVHRRIRNDPDYDDWEYGTEPLPHEAWLKRPAADSQAG